mmetsp:Transcript_102556/g.311410  ORF Transcript_102556/g.311410 Transcript_102556/m.311410 type:complete len:399 (+) Transcript_102556:61-1257(+)
MHQQGHIVETILEKVAPSGSEGRVQDAPLVAKQDKRCRVTPRTAVLQLLGEPLHCIDGTLVILCSCSSAGIHHAAAEEHAGSVAHRVHFCRFKELQAALPERKPTPRRAEPIPMLLLSLHNLAGLHDGFVPVLEVHRPADGDARSVRLGAAEPPALPAAGRAPCSRQRLVEEAPPGAGFRRHGCAAPSELPSKGGRVAPDHVPVNVWPWVERPHCQSANPCGRHPCLLSPSTDDWHRRVQVFRQGLAASQAWQAVPRPLAGDEKPVNAHQRHPASLPREEPRQHAQLRAVAPKGPWCLQRGRDLTVEHAADAVYCYADSLRGAGLWCELPKHLEGDVHQGVAVQVLGGEADAVRNGLLHLARGRSLLGALRATSTTAAGRRLGRTPQLSAADSCGAAA